MKIQDFINELYRLTEDTPEHYTTTCDTLKIGNPDAELKAVAVSMFATADVIRQAAAWGANLLIVHEPTFYQHYDNPAKLDATPECIHQVIETKREFIRQHGLTIYRYHDHPHRRIPDLISEGQTLAWGLKGTWQKGEFYAVNDFVLDNAMPALEIVKTLEENLDIQHIRICGARDTMVKSIGLCFGTPGHLEEQIRKNDMIVTGEICEWSQGEFLRDLVEIYGEKKTLLVLGHIPSERMGMKLLAERIPQHFPALPAKYFECGETYSYL